MEELVKEHAEELRLKYSNTSDTSAVAYCQGRIDSLNKGDDVPIAYWKAIRAILEQS